MRKKTTKPSAPRAAKRPRARPGDVPRVPRSFVAQEESRRLLEGALSPWMVTRWNQSDFGIDAVVEIASAVPGTSDREASGRLFAVQLKSTDDPKDPDVLRISTGHLRYWLNHSLPVLLVSAHLPSGRMRSRWIDDSVLVELRQRSPTFWSQSTVSVPLLLDLAPTSHSSLETAVLRFRPRERALSPTRFFELRERVLALAADLDAAAAGCGIESVRRLATEARGTLRASSYMVAIVGPQRVGKSTLVNALLGIDVSPVADYPTTAVPLLFESGERPEAEIVFADGEHKTVVATSKALRPYAAHQENDANSKGIRVIRVTLPNDVLARGVSLVDTPGLHDASAVVRQVTKAAIDNADAILFVLDASLGPKFKLGQAEIEDLASLQNSKERVIVVLNQADGLPAASRAPLSAYVESQLKKHGIWNGLPVHPLFASGREGWEARVKNAPPPPSFRILEEELWGHLLKNRGTGMHRLASAVNRLGEACETGEALLSDRADKGSQAGELDRARRTCEQAIARAESVAREWNASVRRDIGTFLETSKARRTSGLAAQIEKIPLDGVFPSAEQLHARVQHEVLEDGQAIWAVLQRETANITKSLGDIVQDALKESRAQLGIPIQVRIVVSARAMPPIDLSLPEEGVGILGGILGFLANPAIGLATTVLGWIIGRDVAIQKRRVRVLATINKRYAESLHEGLLHLGIQASERLSSTAAALIHQVRGRLETFIADARRRIDRLGSPLSENDAARLRHFAAEMSRIRTESDLVGRELDAVLGDARDVEAA